MEVSFWRRHRQMTVYRPIRQDTGLSTWGYTDIAASYHDKHWVNPGWGVRVEFDIVPRS